MQKSTEDNARVRIVVSLKIFRMLSSGLLVFQARFFLFRDINFYCMTPTSYTYYSARKDYVFLHQLLL